VEYKEVLTVVKQEMREEEEGEEEEEEEEEDEERVEDCHTGNSISSHSQKRRFSATAPVDGKTTDLSQLFAEPSQTALPLAATSKRARRKVVDSDSE
jgi:hypothetical protein